MPVYIYEDDAFDKMAAVEQDERWAEMQKDGSFGHSCLFSSFLEEYNRWKESGYPPEELSRHSLLVDRNGAIYGSGGFNRYTVRGDGEIIFLTGLARSGADRDRAVEQGFRLFPSVSPRTVPGPNSLPPPRNLEDHVVLLVHLVDEAATMMGDAVGSYGCKHLGDHDLERWLEKARRYFPKGRGRGGVPNVADQILGLAKTEEED